MASLQGDFENKAEAQRARASLIEAGVPEDRIRLWNILPEGEAPRSGQGGAVRGAVVGGLLGGVPGLAAGAAIGAGLDEGSGGKAPPPEPSGVRLVVDVDPGGPDVAALLRAAGAAGVHPGFAEGE